MATDFLGTYDPSEVQLTISGLNASGFFDGDFITMARIDPETFKTHVGAHGEVSRTKNLNKAGTITFTLKKTSPFNVTLDLLKLSNAAFPIMCKDNSDASKHIAVATSAWISSEPDIVHGAEEGGVEWVITCADLIMSHL
jgi:hypothetical protein